MGVTVEDVLRLPALRSARVLAGHEGLQKVVTSISVLEYTDPSELQEQFFSLEDFRRGELVISGFVSIKDSVEKQCEVIRRLYEAGEVGLILYYVGIFVPRIDESLLQLAEELSFPLISMPENSMEVQYGSAIYEVTEEIIKEHMTDTYLVAEILEKIAFLPSYRRSMDYLLHLVSNRISASLFLIDDKFRMINCALFQKDGRELFGQICSYYEKNVNRLPADTDRILGETRMIVNCQKIRNGNQTHLYLLVVRENGDLSRSLCWQAAEAVQLYIRVWSQGHGNVGKDEILKAILMDEQVKMQRLADSMQFDVSAIHHMILILPRKNKKENSQVNWGKIQGKVKQTLDKNYMLNISGVFDQCLIILTGEENIKGSYQEIIEALMDDIQGEKEEWQFVLCRGMDNTREVRSTFVECKTYMQEARIIFPLKNPLTCQEIQFAGKCRQTMYRGEESLNAALLPLKDLDERWDADMYKTLETYFLDADMSIVKTAELLYLHKNTIKYRIAKLADIFHYRVNKMPESYELYKAVALHRLMAKLNTKPKNER